MADASVMTATTATSERWVTVEQWAALTGCSVRTAFRKAAKGEAERMTAPDGTVRLRLPETAAVPLAPSGGLGGLPDLVATVMTAKREAEAQMAQAWREAQAARADAAKATRRSLVLAGLAATCVMTAGAWYLTASGSMAVMLQEAAERVRLADEARGRAEQGAAQMAAMARQSQQEAAQARARLAAMEVDANQAMAPGSMLLLPRPGQGTDSPVMTLGQAR